MHEHKPTRFTPPVVEEVKKGKVSGCFELNVRSGPSKDENVKCTLRVGAVVTIDESKSTDAFYSIRTESGLEGYCMTEYITVL